jgi:hypothetical protein
VLLVRSAGRGDHGRSNRFTRWYVAGVHDEDVSPVENFDARTGEGLRDRAHPWTAGAYLILAAVHERRTATPVSVTGPRAARSG